MANETPITIVGNMVDDPELRYTASEAAVANFTVASTPRKFNRQTNEFEDGQTLFQRCSVWREMAENVVESLSKGTRVVVYGNLEGQSWEDKDTGQKRSGTQLNVLEVGPALRYAKAQVTKVQRNQQGGGQQGGGWGGQQQQPQGGGWGGAQQQPGPDWAGQQGAPQGGQQGGWGGAQQPPSQQGGGGWGQPPSQQGPPQQQGGGQQGWGEPNF